jgi:diaminopimelate epimerase
VGRRFWKMSGSGNDFVVFDARGNGANADALEHAAAIRKLSARGTGVGADGVVFVSDGGRAGATVAMRYYNADSSRVDFCGNATLCVTRLAHDWGLGGSQGLVVETDAGLVSARMRAGRPEIDLPGVTDVAIDTGLPLEAGERRIGFALVGVPHVVVRCDDVEKIDVGRRGRSLRHSGYKLEGLNANFVSQREGRWWMRTFERGVEGETLACGSGAVACALLLANWGESSDETSIVTRSGRSLAIRLRRDGAAWRPTLGGEGRIVFTGEVAELAAESATG